MNFYLYLFINPTRAWLAVKNAKWGSVCFIQLLSVIALAAVVEGFGLVKNGRWQPRFHSVRMFPFDRMLAFEIVQAGLFLAMVLISTHLTHKALQTFGSQRPFFQTFKLIIYGFTPLFLMHCLNYSAHTNPWLIWGVSVVFMAWILYQGVPVLLEPDPPQAFGQYIFTIVIMVLSSGAIQLLAALYLAGEIDLQHSALTRKYPQLGHWLSQ